MSYCRARFCMHLYADGVSSRRCGKCVRQRIIRAFLIEEQKIVKRVLIDQQKAKPTPAGK